MTGGARPAPARATMDRAELVRRMVAVLGAGGVISEWDQLRTYECDGLTSHRVVPSLVLLPATAEEVQGVVRVCHEAGVPFVARGSGTGLSGGALPVSDGVLVSLEIGHLAYGKSTTFGRLKCTSRTTGPIPSTPR